MNRRASRILTVCAGAWLLVIWGHSCMPAAQSGAESGALLTLLPSACAGNGRKPEKNNPQLSEKVRELSWLPHLFIYFRYSYSNSIGTISEL